MLSTAIAWFIAFLFSLHDLRKQAMGLIETVKRSLFVVSLVFFTVIVALSGCVGYSESIISEESGADCFPSMRGLRPPNLFTYLRRINAFGIIALEPIWVITVLSKYLRPHGA